MKIVGIDPGGAPPNGTTGISLVQLTNKDLLVEKQWAVENGYWGFCKWVHTEGHYLSEADYVICEKFVPYNKAADISPVLIEGVVGYLRPDTIFQPASGKNKAIPDSFLKNNDWYSDSSHHHDARESLRHVLYWLKSQSNPVVMRMFH